MEKVLVQMRAAGFLVLIVVVAFVFAVPAAAAYQGTDNTTETGIVTPIKVRDSVRAQLEESREMRQRVQDVTLGERQAERDAKLEEHQAAKVERFETRLNALNALLTGRYLKFLERAEAILDKITSRADRAETEFGIDVSAVRSAIAEAQSSIVSVRETTQAQKAKIYTLDLEGYETVREAAQAAREQLREDLHSLRDIHLRAVRDAVHAVFQALKDAISSARPSVSAEPETIGIN